jgi:tRNA dimethylallyltransferase
MPNKLSKLLVICGPTASGKTALAIELAKKYNGALVAADSRTVYRYMDIGTGKELGYPHKLIDVVRPDQTLTLAEYKKKAVAAIRAAIRAGKLPILVGGTGLYIWAIVDNLLIPKVVANEKMRRELQQKTPDALYALLNAIDPSAAKVTGKNKRRIIRALEVVVGSGEKFSESTKKGKPLFDFLEIGLAVPREELVKRIDRRVDAMVKAGFMAEVLKLRKKLFKPDLPAMSGIGYKELNDVIDGKTIISEAVSRIKARTRGYARRQMTWFRRDKRINWVSGIDDADLLIKRWLNAL